MSASFSCSRKMAWMVWIIVSIFYAYQYILRVMPNIMMNDIMQQFGISAATFGQFSGIYYIGYSLMHLPLGILLDRYGPKKIMTLCILCTVVGLAPLVFSSYWIFPILGRLLIGLGSSAAILGLFKIIRMTFDEKHFSRMLSLSVTIGLIGAIYGGGPVSYIRDTFGYQAVIQLLAIAGIFLAFVTYWIVPEVKSTPQGGIASNLKEVLGNYKVICLCLCAGLMVGPLEGFADVWGSAFLKQVYGFENTLAASMPSMIFIGMCVGGPLLSLIADKIGSTFFTIILAGFTMTIGFLILLNGQLSTFMINLNFVLVGICCGYQILAIYKASTYVREEVAGLTTAIANMIIMIFGYAFHTVMSSVINYMGGPNTSEALIYGVSVIPIALCLGTSGFFVLSIVERKTTQNLEVIN